MITISLSFRHTLDFTYIAGMFISDLFGTTTIFGKGVSTGRVWIKVWDSHFPDKKSRAIADPA
jgi:hypothetical protein